jgi:hypothetical protein
MTSRVLLQEQNNNMSMLLKQPNLRSFASTSNLHSSSSKPFTTVRNNPGNGSMAKTFINNQDNQKYRQACEKQLKPEIISNSCSPVVIQSVQSSISKQS